MSFEECTIQHHNRSSFVSAAILLVKAAHEWRKRHSGKLPSSSSQRSEFKDIIKSWQRKIDDIPIEVHVTQHMVKAGTLSCRLYPSPLCSVSHQNRCPA